MSCYFDEFFSVKNSWHLIGYDSFIISGYIDEFFPRKTGDIELVTILTSSYGILKNEFFGIFLFFIFYYLENLHYTISDAYTVWTPKTSASKSDFSSFS